MKKNLTYLVIGVVLTLLVGSSYYLYSKAEEVNRNTVVLQKIIKLINDASKDSNN